MTIHHKVENVKIEKGLLSLTVDGKLVERALADVSPRLSKASSADLAKYEISPSGYGIYWPLIDEDISIDGLLGIKHSPKKSRKSA